MSFLRKKTPLNPLACMFLCAVGRKRRTKNSAPFLRRCPVLLVTDRHLHVVSAAAGYRVGSVDLALRIYKSVSLC